MGYSVENIRYVKDLIESRRRAALEESERRRAALHAEVPELRELDLALRRTGPALFRAACQGGKDSPAYRRVVEENAELQSARAVLLDKLGLPADYTEVHYTCPACGDTGYRDIAMCDCMKRELVLAGFRSSGLGVLIDRQSFDNFSLDYYKEDPENYSKMKKNLAAARKYAKGFSLRAGNLLFMGRTGVGKTHLSTAIARTVIERGFDVRYDSAQNIFADFEFDRFKSNYGAEAPRSDKYLEADLLIIDDLGTETVTQFTLTCLYNIINTRLNAGRPTIINTNLGYGELRERYNDRIVSRLVGEFRPLTFVGEDVRFQKIN